ncbi:CcmD family protein [Sphingobacterium sp. Ka21]|uniref:CcmD family protein n=2 Tax=Sphingobacterium pedocola TaxID=2082722 RepID=A0ABR9T3I5_9SPHI|nr:CcmD family protein [Sphingobacterium pedocola]
MKTLMLTFLSIICLLRMAVAQPQMAQIEMATGLRSSGKIWVVVLVVLTLIIGVFLYLFSIDRKIRKLENHK